jgi:hypothetical protein
VLLARPTFLDDTHGLFLHPVIRAVPTVSASRLYGCIGEKRIFCLSKVQMFWMAHRFSI